MSAIKLGDFITLKRGTTYKSQLLGQEGAVLIGLASIQREGGFRDDKLETYGGECPEKISLRAGDLYVSLKDITNDGHLLGAVARIPEKIKLGRLTQDTVKLVFLKDEFPRNYIYWLLRTPQCRNYCRSFQTGTTNLGLSREDFLSFQVPPLTDFSSSIVASLEAIEKKIENLKRQNETLEQIAQTLFKHWFIDFEFPNADGKPYKSSGGAMVASELGDIPEGWKVGTLGDVAKNHSETHSFKGKSKIIFVNTGDVLEGNFLHENYMPIDKLPGQAKKKIAKDDILYSEIRPKNKRFAYVNFNDNTENYVVSTKFMVVRTNDLIVPRLLYLILKRQESIDEFNYIAESRSGTFPQITFEAVSYFKFPLAPLKIQKYLMPLLTNLLEKKEFNISQIQTLTKIRDSLLPKLMSGQLRVKE